MSRAKSPIMRTGKIKVAQNVLTLKTTCDILEKNKFEITEGGLEVMIEKIYPFMGRTM